MSSPPAGSSVHPSIRPSINPSVSQNIPLLRVCVTSVPDSDRILYRLDSHDYEKIELLLCRWETLEHQGRGQTSENYCFATNLERTWFSFTFFQHVFSLILPYRNQLQMYFTWIKVILMSFAIFFSFETFFVLFLLRFIDYLELWVLMICQHLNAFPSSF